MDADIGGFFDTINHDWMITFLERRVGDNRVLRLIRNWLQAGVSEDGEVTKTSVGTPQGAVISPLLSNVFLHYVFDLWINWWRESRRRGDMIVVRYADDFVIGFQHRSEAEACLEELRARFAKFGLRLHDGKTRLLVFGRFAATNRRRRGEGKAETFDFLGFTHKCAVRRSDGSFTIHRHTIAKRMRATLLAIRVKLRKRMHHPIGEVGRWLRRVVQGWMNYHAVPSNSDRVRRFIDEVTRNWLRAIRRRSQRGKNSWTWARMKRLGRKHLPQPHIIHPYPEQRFRQSKGSAPDLRQEPYFPHHTLRNLWTLGAHVDPVRLRMEILNQTRNAEKYEGDPLAPSAYPPDTLFATVMFASPLGWFETSNLPESYFKTIPPLVAAWKKEREAIFSGHIIPIGSAPDGAAWTGFSSISKGRRSARVVVFRELNAQSTWKTEIPLLDAKNATVTVLGGKGSAVFKDGFLTSEIPETLQYIFLKITVDP